MIARIILIGLVVAWARVEATPLDVVGSRHDLLTRVLRDHVSAGEVDYSALARDSRLDRYLATIARTDPGSLTHRDEQLALWINAYNAYTLKLVADAYPIESIHDLATGGMIIGWLINRTAWDIRFAEVGGTVYTLNEIEQEILRPKFQEPRIHFAIVCAAVSCPPLRAEAYEAARLDDQLNEQGRIFLRDSRHNRFDYERHEAQLSKIFAWFAEDFGDTTAARLRFFAQFLPSESAATISSAAESWKVRHLRYDWSLNDGKAGP